jgi:hypothetical protein
MNIMDTVKVSISRVAVALDSTAIEQPHFCRICVTSPPSSSLAATLSCCNSSFHLDCLTSWICRILYSPTPPSDPTDAAASNQRMATCPACRASIEPTGFFTALALLADRHVEVVDSTESTPSQPATRQVNTIRTVVTVESVESRGMLFNPDTLGRQALRSDNGPVDWDVQKPSDELGQSIAQEDGPEQNESWIDEFTREPESTTSSPDAELVAAHAAEADNHSQSIGPLNADGQFDFGWDDWKESAFEYAHGRGQRLGE